LGSRFNSEPAPPGEALRKEVDMKHLVWIAGLSLFAQLAVAAPQPTPYHYGDDLDVAKVISMEVPNGGCSVVEATMTYLDSKGETHTMSYLRQGADCIDH